MSGISEQELFKTRIRSGNIADCSFNSLLCYKFGSISKRPEPSSNVIMMKPDIHVDLKLMAEHNVILLGAGNVNCVTQRVLRDFKESLPIHFEAPEGHEIIYSDISRNHFDFQSSHVGILAMLPNIYTTDVDADKHPNKVIIVCAGLEIQGTQAAMLALCKGIDDPSNKLGNNVHDNRFPFRIVEAVVERSSITNLAELTTQSWDVVGFKFVE